MIRSTQKSGRATFLQLPFFFALLLLFVGSAVAQTCVEPPPGMVAWWPFDETSGTLSHDIIGANDGQQTNGPVPATGMVGGALRFDGVNDYVVVPDSDLWAFGTNDFTIELWVNFDAPPSGDMGHPSDVFISHDTGPFNVPKWFFAMNATDIEFLACCDTGWAFSPRAPFSPVIGQWYHLAVTRSGTDYRIYVDGGLAASGANVAEMPNPEAFLTIGRALEGTWDSYMTGLLDEVSVYHQALTQEELRAIVNAGVEGKCKGVTVRPQTLSAIQLGAESSQQIEAISGILPYSWSVVGGVLPLGMTLSTEGVLSGTPTELGDFTFIAQVTDGVGGVDARQLTVSVVLALPPPDIRIKATATIAVPGRSVDQFIVVENTGVSAADDISLVNIVDPNITLQAITPPGETDGDTLQESTVILWNIGSLQAGDVAVLSHQGNVSPSVPLGVDVGQPVCKGEQLSIIAQCIQEVQGSVPSQCFERDCAALLAGLYGCAVEPISLGCAAILAALEICMNRCELEGLVAAEACLEGAGCEIPPLPTSGPVDPNEKLVVAEHFVQPDQTLVYPIHFENIGDVEAIDVFVTDVLDPNLDLSTLELLTPDGAAFDAATRTVRWDLLGRNLLPGETGNVLLSAKPVPGLPSGTEIRNAAEIQFEIFDPLVTPEVVNVIDTTKPNCEVDALPAVTSTEEFTVAWTGTDEVGEIEAYAVFVSKDGAGFAPAFDETEETSAQFIGADGSTYEFLCAARDTAGNTEEEALVTEAVTTITVVSNQPPVAQCKAVTVAADAQCLGTASVNDDSYDPDGGSVTLSQSPEGPYGLGETSVTLTVTDDSGATDSCVAMVTVVDTTAPSLTPPPPVTVECTTTNGATVDLGIPTVSDACDGSPTIVNDAPALFPIETTVVTWSATDASGNVATATQEVVVETGVACGTSGRICSVLGNDPKPSLLDQDIFEFQGKAGDAITITLEKDPSGTTSGDQASLILKQKGTLSLLGVDRSALPNQVSVTLPKAATYRVIVGEQPKIQRAEPFRGDYCLTLDAPAGAVETFKPTAGVE